jgi:hypothetical protein
MITFNSILKNHSIIVELDMKRKQALINTMNIGDPSTITEFAVLLKKMSSYLKETNNITTIVQQISKDDWINIIEPLKKFELIEDNNEFITAICPIYNFPETVLKAIGL